MLIKFSGGLNRKILFFLNQIIAGLFCKTCYSFVAFDDPHTSTSSQFLVQAIFHTCPAHKRLLISFRIATYWTGRLDCPFEIIPIAPGKSADCRFGVNGRLCSAPEPGFVERRRRRRRENRVRIRSHSSPAPTLFILKVAISTFCDQADRKGTRTPNLQLPSTSDFLEIFRILR